MENKKKYENIEILHSVLLTYKDGNKEFINAIYQTKCGVITGRILENNVFLEIGFIPEYNIKDIKGRKRKINIVRKKLYF